jgi:hypothetical protein
LDLAVVTGTVPLLHPHVAADGIDEALRVFLHRMHVRGFPADLTAPLSVVATDVDRSWTLRPGPMTTTPPQPGEPQVSDGAMPSSDRIEGPAAALYALVWKRLAPTDPSLSFSGDTGLIERFLASRLTA